MKVTDSRSIASQRDNHNVHPDNLATGSVSARAARKREKKTRASVRSAAARKTSNAQSDIKRKGTVGSKQDRVIALLRRPGGATLDDLVKATGWQPHSVRGFLAGTIRKRLKLPLQSENVKGTRRYRTKAGKAAAKVGSSRAV
jgi:Protein of unknown function (DUF3489)